MDDPLKSFKAEADKRLQEIKVTPELRTRTLERLQKHSGKKRFRYPTAWAAAAAVLLAIVIALQWIGDDPVQTMHLAGHSETSTPESATGDTLSATSDPQSTAGDSLSAAGDTFSATGDMPNVSSAPESAAIDPPNPPSSPESIAGDMFSTTGTLDGTTSAPASPKPTVRDTTSDEATGDCPDCPQMFGALGTPEAEDRTFHAPLPSYVPDGFTLSESDWVHAEGTPAWRLHYVTDDKDHYTIVITWDEDASPREPLIVNEGPPLEAEWSIPNLTYRLSGTITAAEALNIGASISASIQP